MYLCAYVQARAYNCQIRPAVLDSSSRVKWTNTAHHPPFLVGEEVSTCLINFVYNFYETFFFCLFDWFYSCSSIMPSCRLFLWTPQTVTTSTGRWLGVSSTCTLVLQAHSLLSWLILRRFGVTSYRSIWRSPWKIWRFFLKFSSEGIIKTPESCTC